MLAIHTVVIDDTALKSWWHRFWRLGVGVSKVIVLGGTFLSVLWMSVEGALYAEQLSKSSDRGPQIVLLLSAMMILIVGIAYGRDLQAILPSVSSPRARSQPGGSWIAPSAFQVCVVGVCVCFLYAALAVLAELHPLGALQEQLKEWRVLLFGLAPPIFLIAFVCFYIDETTKIHLLTLLTLSMVFSAAAITLLISSSPALSYLLIDNGALFRAILKVLRLPVADGAIHSPGAAAELANAINTTLTALSAGTAAVASGGLIVDKLNELISVRGYSVPQKLVAGRLRQPVSGAAPKDASLDLLYPKQIDVSRDSFRRQLPFVNQQGSNKARIRILVQDEPFGSAPNDFRIDWLESILNSANLSLDDSLFFVYRMERNDKANLLCYGTGQELRVLLTHTVADPNDESELIGDAFRRALSIGEKQTIARIVSLVRGMMLSKSPHSQALLTSEATSASSPLGEVLSQMAEHKLQRILLTSGVAPAERAIVGTPELTRFLTHG
ncbi:MAG: hypothetical protein ABL973_12290 [Micropepsaceae bacterium]